MKNLLFSLFFIIYRLNYVVLKLFMRINYDVYLPTVYKEKSFDL